MYRVFTGTQAGPVAFRQVFAEEFKKTNIGLIYAEKGPLRQMLHLYCWECVRDRLLLDQVKEKEDARVTKEADKKRALGEEFNVVTADIQAVQ